LTIGKAGKLVLAIRSSHGLEVPLSDPVSGQLLVDKNYLTFLTNIANEKLAENLRRIQFFEQRCDKYVWKD
jgi:tRNA wybutosine-synthesizing protein 3